MTETASLPQRVGGHYRVEGLLGVGGMSRVLTVLDERDGRRLALKQLLDSSRAPRQARTLAQFRQEFHVLTQIAHPNVVAVDAYGFEADQPFYTMELVVGQALDALAPLGWQQLCGVLLDLCSPLSLLHARRFVHSDITARNVLISERGITKLIDFGALTAIDAPTSTIAGTPPYMAPELVNRLQLDGRVDVFALGALAYYVLSGRHAYPARSIRALEHVWSVPPRSLTELGVALPVALDHLVMSMLSLDPAARPVQMAELVQRLCAITGDTQLDRGAISAYAPTPRLVAREAQLEVFRAVHASMAQGNGDLLCVAGAKGMGRSRMLDACALEAGLGGSLVLRASAEQAARLDYGVFASVLLSAVHQQPELAAMLGPGLATSANKAEAELEILRLVTRDDAGALLDAWWDALTARRPVVLLVDDLARADLPSVQRLLLLAESSKRRRLLVVVCVGNGESVLERNLNKLLRMGRVLKLRALSAIETEQLLRSMFGDISQLTALASWVHSAAAGVPAACVELAQYALARGVIRYRAGQFELAGDVALLELPRGYDDAILARIRALGAHAREALGALSLLTAFGALSAPEHAELLGHAGWTQAETLAALDELLDAQLLKQRAEGYELHSEAVRRIAQAELGAEGCTAWHARLGAFYQSRGHARSMLAALHLEYAGERERAYAQLLLVDANIEGPDDPNVPLGGSALGIALHQAMRDHAIALQRRVEILHFRRILLELGATSNPSLGADGLDLLEQFRLDAGLDSWDQTDPLLSENQKLMLCLARGQERYLAMPAAERGVPVRDAVRLLAQCASVLASICALTFDRVTVRELVRLFEPLRTLTPLLGITSQMLENSKIGLTQGGRMTERWSTPLAALATRPEGMRELIWRYVLSNLQCHVSREAAVLGDERFLVHAEALTRIRRRQHQVLSLKLLYALAMGRFDESRRMRRELEIAAVASGHEDQLVAFAHIAELELLEACGDLLELKRLSTWFDARARRYPGWTPFAALARAAGLLLCDQPHAAEAALSAQLDAAPALEHAAWYAVRALRAEAVWLAGDAALARQLAEALLQQAAAVGVDMTPNIRAQRVLALASASLGDSDSAIATLSPLLRECEGLSSVRAGQVFETRARIALYRGDSADYAEWLARVKAIYSAGAYPGLLARLERLQAAGRRVFEPDASARTSTEERSDRSAWRHDGLQAELERLHGEERASYLLSLLIADSRASAGRLYRVGDAGAVTLINTPSVVTHDSETDDSVSEYVAHLSALDEETTRHDTSESEYAARITTSLTSGSVPYEVVPLRDRNGVLRGVALLSAESRATKLACTPALCSMVGDALERIS